jgi:mono/diheme cytochrome c family protein
MQIKSKYLILVLISGVLILENCKNRNEDTPQNIITDGTSKIEASTQRVGNADEGFKYLTTGNYLSSGIPLEIYKLAFGANDPDDLGRTGDGKGVNYAFNAVTAENGVKIAVNSCLSCHADKLNGQVLVGLGNTTADNSIDLNQQLDRVDAIVQFRYGKASPEWKAYEAYSRGFHAVAPFIKTEVRGINPADKIFAALSAFRDKNNLTWLATPQFTIPTRTVPTDVPAWWLLKKKNALYFNGLGKGDHASLMSSASLVTLKDTAEARQIDARFPDVVAYLKTLKAPKYPYPIDQTLASKGKMVFLDNCSKCHGTYDAVPTYPNYLVDVKTIGTDPALANEYENYPFYHTWYNDSWFAKKSPKSQLIPQKGYVSPPLDGIWATAPYLHNGSIPSIEALLNSTTRPKYWSRLFENTTAEYNTTQVGWKYTNETAKKDNLTYDTTLYGYGNQGHYYGDKLSADDRKAVIEYLKTL